MSRIRIKVCGIREREFALAACEMGVDALGFIFYEKSIRYISPQATNDIIRVLPPFVDSVGVFVNAPVRQVVSTAYELSLNYIQLHGAEDLDYVRQCKKEWGGKVIKAVPITRQEFPIDEIERYLSVADYVLLDTKTNAGFGGTGAAFDWAALATLPENIKTRVIVAGGISPDNIEHLLHYAPSAIDVNSGIEIKPGEKSVKLLQQLLSKIKGAMTDEK